VVERGQFRRRRLDRIEDRGDQPIERLGLGRFPPVWAALP
jgi:hypothetical protein